MLKRSGIPLEIISSFLHVLMVCACANFEYESTRTEYDSGNNVEIAVISQQDDWSRNGSYSESNGGHTSVRPHMLLLVASSNTIPLLIGNIGACVLIEWTLPRQLRQRTARYRMEYQDSEHRDSVRILHHFPVAVRPKSLLTMTPQNVSNERHRHSDRISSRSCEI